ARVEAACRLGLRVLYGLEAGEQLLHRELFCKRSEQLRLPRPGEQSLGVGRGYFYHHHVAVERAQLVEQRRRLLAVAPEALEAVDGGGSVALGYALDYLA